MDTNDQNVIEQMADNGLKGSFTNSLSIDGKMHRVRPDWEPKAKKKRGFYIFWYFCTDSGKNYIVGTYGWFKGSETYKFNVSLKSGVVLTQAEKKRFAQEQEEKQKLAKVERQKEIAATEKRALDIWNKLPTQGRSPYLQRKKVTAFNIRFTRGSIVLPVYGFDRVLSGLQFIDPEGNKKFLTGTVKKGRFCILGESINPSGYMAICEGYATGASIRMATNWIVFIAFDAGNLIHVAKAVREKYRQAKIVICGDDDFGNPCNPGRVKAEQTAKDVKGVAVFPVREVAA
jgi:putative DNA primase/helicase